MEPLRGSTKVQANIIRPDSLTISLTLSSSEASALITLLTEGYDWYSVDHNWNPLVMILTSFTNKAVIAPASGSTYPFAAIPKLVESTDPAKSA